AMGIIMNIRVLEYLVMLAEKKHFRKAAEACHVSQPTLSEQIRKLESSLNINLLERTSRRVIFTQSGLLLIEQAKVILKEVQILKDLALAQKDEMLGPLLLGMIPTLSPYILPDVLEECGKSFPELSIQLSELNTSELLARLELGLIDCAIMAIVPETDAFIEIPLIEEKFKIAVSKKNPLSKKEYISNLDLQESKFLILNENHCFGIQSLQYCISAGLTKSLTYNLDNLETVRNLVKINFGIAFMPELALKSEEDIEYLNFKDTNPYRVLALVYRPGSPLKNRYERIAQVLKVILNKKLALND
ncbi:MAG: DNA-binding transcriptional regulator OxyR, partial [Psittacicella sp.]